MKDRNPPGEDNPAAQMGVWGVGRAWRGEGSKEVDRAKFRPQGVCSEPSAQRAHRRAKGWGVDGGEHRQALQPGQSGTFPTTSESFHLAETPFHQLKMQMVIPLSRHVCDE